MRVLVRVMAVSVVMAAAAAGGLSAFRQADAGSRATTSYLGTWEAVATIHCSNHNGLNAIICPLRLGRQDLATSWIHATSTAAGKFSFTATYMLAEDAPKAKPLCDKNVLTTPYAGTCYITSAGSGLIKTGETGGPDFWITSETDTYYNVTGNVVTKNPMGAGGYPYDTGIPAVVGSFDAAKILRTLHLITTTQAPPAGLYIEIQVSHKA